MIIVWFWIALQIRNKFWFHSIGLSLCCSFISSHFDFDFNLFVYTIFYCHCCWRCCFYRRLLERVSVRSVVESFKVKVKVFLPYVANYLSPSRSICYPAYNLLSVPPSAYIYPHFVVCAICLSPNWFCLIICVVSAILLFLLMWLLKYIYINIFFFVYIGTGDWRSFIHDFSNEMSVPIILPSPICG